LGAIMNGIEVHEPAFTSKEEAAPLLDQAREEYREFQHGGISLAISLWKLQIGGAHIHDGCSSFASWAAQRIDGLGESNAKQLTRMGAVALELVESGRLDPEEAAKVIGSTGLRALSPIYNKHGAEKMIEVFDVARGNVPDRAAVDVTINAAARQLGCLPLPREPLASPAEPDEDADDDVPDEQEQRFFDLMERARDLTDDIRDSTGPERTRAIDELVELARELRNDYGEPRPSE
jgi:hypothetical protein